MSEAPRLLRKAEEDMAKGRLDLAAERFEKVLHANRKDVAALNGMARVALATDSYEEARKFAQEALTHDPNNADAMVFAALALEALGETEQALEQLARAVDLHQDHFLTMFHAGRLSAAIGNYEQALSFLNKASELQPDSYDVEHLRGLVLVELDYVGDAIDLLREVVRMDPRRLEGYFSLADTLLVAEEVDLAERVLEQARKNLGNDPIIMQKQAGISLFKGDLADALANARRIAERVPNSVQAWMNVGMLELLNKDVERAEKALLQAVEVDPELWEPRFQLGMLYDGVGLDDKAIAAYEEAARLAPEQWEPHNNLGLLLLASDAPALHAKAEQCFRQALEASGATILGPYFNLALALTKQDKSEEALELCNQLLKEELPPETRTEIERLRQEITS